MLMNFKSNGDPCSCRGVFVFYIDISIQALIVGIFIIPVDDLRLCVIGKIVVC